MSWNGDQFEYTRGYISALIKYYLPLYEAALKNPFSIAAVMVYDIDCALQKITLTPKQEEAFALRMNDYTYREIADELGISKQSVWERIGWAEKKIKSELCMT